MQITVDIDLDEYQNEIKAEMCSSCEKHDSLSEIKDYLNELDRQATLFNNKKSFDEILYDLKYILA